MRENRFVNHRAVFILVLAAVMLFGSSTRADLLVSSSGNNEILRYDQSTGAFKGVFASGLSDPTGMTFGPDGNLYVSNAGTDQILRFNGQTGASLGVFVPDANLGGPTYLTFGPDGNLDVLGGNRIRRYNGSTGAFMNNLVDYSQSSYGVNGLAFGNGNLFYGVNLFSGSVTRADAGTGAFLGDSGSPAGTIVSGMTLGPDGDLYVNTDQFSSSAGEISRFDGTTGAFLNVLPNTYSLGAFSGLVFGPDGAIYVASSYGPDGNQVLRYDTNSGTLGTFIGPASGGLNSPFDLAFTPQVSGVPVPSGLTLASLGVLGLLGGCYRRRCRPAVA